MNKPTSCALVALLVGCMAAQTAHAQTTAGNPPPSDTVPALGGDLPNATGQTSKEGGDIVVTGSRIARRDYTSSSPISTVSSDFIAKSDSSTLETSLNQLPQIASSASSSTNT